MVINNAHSFEFMTETVENHVLSHVYLDGKKLNCVRSAEVSFSVDELPIVKLEFIAGRISGNINKADVNGGMGDGNVL